ncbi:transposase [Parasutterella secunda]|uniref:transposase n=1 Tax=Parasutterella secunda TaxID=626947 RepID=UPI0020117D09|nr:transposase [Parasutterella secunda]MCL1596948.1 transposase [Parasutterella secunda]
MHKRFSEEFKKSAIIRVQNGESQLSVANSLGISYKTLNRWIIQAKGQMPSENVSLSEENARLRKALKEREAEIAFLKKSSGVLRKDVVTRYAFLEHCIRCAEVGRHAALPVTRACHLLGVSVSGFYA